MRPVVLLFGIVTAPLALGDSLFLPTTESERSRLPLDKIHFTDVNEHAVPGSVNVYRVNVNALVEPNAIITIPRGSGEALLRIRINSIKQAQRSIDGRAMSCELFHPDSDETTPILLFLQERRVDSLEHYPFFDAPNQEFVYSISGSIPIRWEQTIMQIRTLSLSPDMVITYDVEPRQTARDKEESNAYLREWIRKRARMRE